MGISRIVNTDFWEDGMVNDSFSPEDKYFMLYLMTNPHSKQAGIYKLNKKIAAFEMGYSPETVSSLIERFSTKYHRIIYSNETQEIAVLNAPKYNIVKGGKPVNDCIEKDLSQIKNRSLVYKMYNHLKNYFEQSDKPSIQQVGEVFKKASNNFKESNEIDNDIDNDNDSIVGVSCNESYHESSDTMPKGVDVSPESKFEQFYSAYPKHVGKEKALASFKKIKPDDTLFEIILKAVASQSKTEDWTKENKKYVPMPATWLNGKRWEDEINESGKGATTSDGHSTYQGTGKPNGKFTDDDFSGITTF